jgi:diadenosine tetraphosphate (Ap4A) HIT family hydrolase
MRNFECPFCNREKESILYESENFYVTPTLGGFVEGYLLICTKEHFIGLNQLPEELFQELDEVKEKVREILSEIYTEPVFFEHGVIDEIRKGGCCIDHAHLHAIPIDFDIFDDIARNIEARKIDEIKKLIEQRQRKMQYFYYENQKGDKYVFDLEIQPPSQYLRRLIAARIGLVELWNWEENPEFSNFYETLKKLRGKF